ncbi:MAG: RNA-binding S4 domain-containing protein [Bacteroidetes bacterium]|nr:MAG: RNA-binding S4 domain-containing protein [Bacteroidota bacterium]
MKQIRFPLNGDFIELYKLLKFIQLADSGGNAKMMVEEGLVKLNGETEYRKRAKVKPGDVVEAEGYRITVEP